jgi:hypothetical protein
MAAVEYHCRRLAQTAAVSDPTNSCAVSMTDVAKHLLNCQAAVSQMPGWCHVEHYIRNPLEYLDLHKLIPLPSSSKQVDLHKLIPLVSSSKQTANNHPSAAVPLGMMDDLLTKGQNLIKRQAMRIAWVMRLQIQAQVPPTDPQIYMKVIAADRLWAADANAYMKEAELKVTAMLTENQPKFHAFRELQRKGVQWPHTSTVRKDIEAAGFVYRPMMIKRDRCICETCLAEISGWRAWQCAWAYHDYSRHNPSFLDKARAACAYNRVVLKLLDETKSLLARPKKPPVPKFSE